MKETHCETASQIKKENHETQTISTSMHQEGNYMSEDAHAEAAIRTAAKPPPWVKPKQPEKKHMLCGMFLHTLNADGSLNRQGRLLEYQDGIFKMQCFSWLDGGATTIEIISIDDVKNAKSSRLYSTNEQMVYAHLELLNSRGELVGSIEECMDAWRELVKP